MVFVFVRFHFLLTLPWCNLGLGRKLKRILRMCFFEVMVGLYVSHCIGVVVCASVGHVRFLGLGGAAGVRYVERIIVVADGPTLVFVHGCFVSSVLFV